MEVVLTIAGSDTSAGAGIQQDLKTITALGQYGATVITALTAQNTVGVQAVEPVSGELVARQIRSVMDDLDVRAIKIGMIPTLEVAKAIVEEITNYKLQISDYKLHIVWDPVMISTSGTRLMAEECIAYLQENLAPLCTLITPNLPESDLFDEPFKANMLIKGGHASGEEMTDTLYLTNGTIWTYTAQKIASTNLHGTGCTLSSAIASYLAKGLSLPESVRLAKKYLTIAILAGKDQQISHGNGPLGFVYYP